MNRDDIIRLAQEAGWEMPVLNEWDAHDGFLQRLERFHAIAVAAEREACAKMVDHILKEGGGTYGKAIRARDDT